MISVEVRVEPDITNALRETINSNTGQFNSKVQRKLSQLGSRLLEELRKEPGPPKYPLRWASAKQRRFVMAKLRRENNLPYTRTHALVRGYRVVLDVKDDGGVFLVENESAVARYVVGDDQQPFHIDTGWRGLADIVTTFEDDAQDELIDTWYEVTT